MNEAWTRDPLVRLAQQTRGARLASMMSVRGEREVRALWVQDWLTADAFCKRRNSFAVSKAAVIWLFMYVKLSVVDKRSTASPRTEDFVW